MVTHERRAKRRRTQGANAGRAAARAQRPLRITAETPYGECSERLTAFGDLLALVKFPDLLGFEPPFAQH